MKKQLSFSLVILFFLTFAFNSYASFPVKKVSNTETSSELKKEDKTTETYAVNVATTNSGKSQIVAALLCFFVGAIGIHRFYLGYTWQGIVQIFTLGGLGVWVLIDFIRILIGDLQPKDGSYDKTF